MLPRSLTLDFKRTNSYVGTVLVQTIVSVLSLVPPAISMGLFGNSETESLAIYIPGSVHILCTLYLLTSLLLSKRKGGLDAPWMSNSKDVMLGSSSSQSSPGWFGRTRTSPLRRRDVSMFPYFWTVYVPKILFRRVSPVESKRYAFFQNFCALLFMAMIIIRAVLAFTQAQNQIETRSGAGSCHWLPAVKNLRVLVRHQDTNRLGVNSKIGKGYEVAVRVATLRDGQYQCSSESQHASTNANNWFQVFSCRSPNNNDDNYFREATYTITMRSTNGTTLDAVRFPDIWFADVTDTFQDASGLGQQGFMSSVAPWLIPPWQMIGGKHIEANVGLVERRFITSSVFRDIVASLKPAYKSASLFTITTMAMTPSSDNFTASALLSPSFVSTLSYLNSPSDFLRIKSLSNSMPLVCAFIEDYRSSTIFDAIGSIGGLLAILQGAHILLFGRPMFWGLAGAKLINPFGLFGSCYSRGFKRRLRERYHRRPTMGQTGDAAEVMRINAFLRDFVIDFGLADVNDEEDVESGRSAKRELSLQANRKEPYGDNEYVVNNSFLPLPRSKVDRQHSQGSVITMETTSSKWEP
ncbi:hypothetical protein FRC09_012568 [Ceratobasidium sp. 395]|nr:hypothetical protein FRC09_012568 [Ceratobasidium sp. 395]